LINFDKKRDYEQDLFSIQGDSDLFCRNIAASERFLSRYEPVKIREKFGLLLNGSASCSVFGHPEGHSWW